MLNEFLIKNQNLMKHFLVVLRLRPSDASKPVDTDVAVFFFFFFPSYSFLSSFCLFACYTLISPRWPSLLHWLLKLLELKLIEHIKLY